MQKSTMTATKAPDDDFLQIMSSEIELHTGRIHLYEMEIRKHKMVTEW